MRTLCGIILAAALSAAGAVNYDEAKVGGKAHVFAFDAR